MRSSGLVVALLALAVLVNFSTARMVDIDLLLPSQEHVGHKKAPLVCCDFCLCNMVLKPPQCRCEDQMIGGCRLNCEKCECTKSIPPKCFCRDILSEDDCGDPCSA